MGLQQAEQHLFGGGVIILVEMVEGEADGISGVHGRRDETNPRIVSSLPGYCVSA
jgi:hypothetical protein